MSGTDIFLSYARADRPAARHFAECFADEGFSVWWDAALHSGETFDEVIEKNLRDAKAVVVLWSPRSVASRWVRAEATLADRRHKLAPAIIEPCDRPIIFELTHAADLADWDGDTSDIRWQTFVQDLRRLVDAESSHEPPATERPAAKPPAARTANGAAETAQRFPAAHRRPLRPGNDDVILAASARREPLHLRREMDRLPDAVAETPTDEIETDPLAEYHCLEIEEGELPQALFVVTATGLKIGRTAPADIVLAHRSVSREHCMIGLANDELLVTDLNSTNGTYVDDQRVSRSTIVPVGSVLRVGQVSLKHEIRSDSEAFGRGNPAGAQRGGGLGAGRLAVTS